MCVCRLNTQDCVMQFPSSPSPQVFRRKIWMGMHGSSSCKPTCLWSNSHRIQALNLGPVPAATGLQKFALVACVLSTAESTPWLATGAPPEQDKAGPVPQGPARQDTMEWQQEQIESQSANASVPAQSLVSEHTSLNIWLRAYPCGFGYAWAP